tara:strand:- start:10275 stop:10469 length:195 start_codon:yes stop_codon:yes gene_type:complete
MDQIIFQVSNGTATDLNVLALDLVRGIRYLLEVGQLLFHFLVNYCCIGIAPFDDGCNDLFILEV